MPGMRFVPLAFEQEWHIMALEGYTLATIGDFVG